MDLVYQRSLKLKPPEGIPIEMAPSWSWPVGLADGRTILTFLWREQGGAPRTVILELSAAGEAQVWRPGIGYPAPVIVSALHNGDLVGLDLIKTGKLYACRPDGEHRWTLETSVRMDCVIASRFSEDDRGLHWMDAAGAHRVADVSTGSPSAITKVEGNLPGTAEIHFPHTHVTEAGRLYVLDFDPIARVSIYVLDD